MYVKSYKHTNEVIFNSKFYSKMCQFISYKLFEVKYCKKIGYPIVLDLPVYLCPIISDFYKPIYLPKHGIHC